MLVDSEEYSPSVPVQQEWTAASYRGKDINPNFFSNNNFATAVHLINMGTALMS